MLVYNDSIDKLLRKKRHRGKVKGGKLFPHRKFDTR